MAALVSCFVSGFLHLLHGADHIVAMLAVGVWGARIGGRAIWSWPMVFVATMLVGFAIGTVGLEMPFIQPAIYASVIVLGLVAAFAVEVRMWLGAALIALFALFHGHAHGTEAVAASTSAYAAGLAVATGGLHVAGICACRASHRAIARAASRTMRAVIVLGAMIAVIAG
jgi:urease accessory protein